MGTESSPGGARGQRAARGRRAASPGSLPSPAGDGLGGADPGCLFGVQPSADDHRSARQQGLDRDRVEQHRVRGVLVDPEPGAGPCPGGAGKPAHGTRTPSTSSAAIRAASGSGLNWSGWARTSTPMSMTPAGTPPGTGSPKASHELARTSSASGSAPPAMGSSPSGPTMRTSTGPHRSEPVRSRPTMAPTERPAITQTGSCQCRGRSTLTTAPGGSPSPSRMHRGAPWPPHWRRSPPTARPGTRDRP